MQAITIGLDLAKRWFQVHGVDAAGKIVVKRRLRRAEVVDFFRGQDPCLVGMEACATAHHWARELIALGHEAKLMPPAYVKAYVKRNKNDAADAAAICEAVTRPSMRFVPVKDVDQQAVLMMHRARNLLVRQRTMAVNALRAHLAEFGGVAPQGLRHVECLVAAIEENQAGLPELARSILRLIVAQLDDTQAKVRQIEARLARWRRNSRLSKLLATVPGVAIMGASAIAATGQRSKPVPVWARIRGLARHDAAPEFLRRQGAAGANQQTRRQIHSLPRRGGGRRSAPCARARDQGWRMGARDAGAKAGQARGGRARQPNRPHRLGGDGAWRWLSSQRDRRASGLNRPQGPQDCEGEKEVMAIRSSRGLGRPEKINAHLSAKS